MQGTTFQKTPSCLPSFSPLFCSPFIVQAIEPIPRTAMRVCYRPRCGFGLWSRRLLRGTRSPSRVGSPHSNRPPRSTHVGRRDGMRTSLGEPFSDFGKYLLAPTMTFRSGHFLDLPFLMRLISKVIPVRKIFEGILT